MRNKFLTLALVLGAVPLAGSVAEYKSFQEKVTEAESIVRGTVRGVETRRDPSGQWLLTYTTIEVADAIKGSPGSSIVVVTPGGTENGLHQRTIGVPEFRVGDERILFTAQSPVGTSILYQDQGTYEIVRDRSAATVVPASSNLILYDSQTDTVKSAEGPLPLEEFVSAVRETSRGFNRDPFRADTTRTGDRGDLDDETIWSPTLIGLLTLGVILASIPLIRKIR